MDFQTTCPKLLDDTQSYRQTAIALRYTTTYLTTINTSNQMN